MDKNELLEFVGNKIRDYRTGKKLTQLEMSKRLGIGKSTFCEYEKGRINIDADMLFKIAAVLEIKVDDLFPARVNNASPIDDTKALRDINVDTEHLVLFKKLYEKTSSLDRAERDKYLETLKLTIEFHDKLLQN